MRRKIEGWKERRGKGGDDQEKREMRGRSSVGRLKGVGKDKRGERGREVRRRERS